MLGAQGLGRIPKVVTVKVNRGEGLQFISKSDHKHAKHVPKWKVVVKGGKKKESSESVFSPNGNPIWNFQATVKLDSKSDPVCIRITDADKHHVGQVVIPLVTIHPRSTNLNERPDDQSCMRVAELEPTKKVSNAVGRIFFWIWVEEYRPIDSDQKSSRGSVMSLSSPAKKHHIGLRRRKNSTSGSVADSLNYSGSVLSIGSSQAEGPEKKKSWFKGRSHKLGSKSALRSNYPASTMSTSNIYESTNRPMYNRPTPSFKNGVSGSFDDHDGSILGAGSEMTNSDLYTSAVTQPSPMHSMYQDGGGRRSVAAAGGGRASSVIATNPMQPAGKPLSQADIITMRNELLGMPSVPTIKPPLDPYQSTSKPQLLGFSPTTCFTTGGVQVTVECSGVTEAMTRHGAVLVDGHNVSRQDWYFKESTGGGHSQLCIRMPERPTGQCWIELETMHQGRLRCPQQFTYTQEPQTSHNHPRLVTLVSDESDSRSHGGSFSRDPEPNSAQRNSKVILIDRRDPFPDKSEQFDNEEKWNQITPSQFESSDKAGFAPHERLSGPEVCHQEASNILITSANSDIYSPFPSTRPQTGVSPLIRGSSIRSSIHIMDRRQNSHKTQPIAAIHPNNRESLHTGTMDNDLWPIQKPDSLSATRDELYTSSGQILSSTDASSFQQQESEAEESTTYLSPHNSTHLEQTSVQDNDDGDSYSSSLVDSENSDEEVPGRDGGTISTILPNPNAQMRQTTKVNPNNSSAVADSGLGSPLPSSSFDPSFSDQMKVNGAHGIRKPSINGKSNLYDPFESQSTPSKNSARGAGSTLGTVKNPSKSPLDESFKMESEGLRGMLKESNDTVAMLKKENTELEQKLAVQMVEVDRLSRELCTLRNRLLQDGMTEYLRK